MWKACSRCGKIHEANYKCNVGRVWNPKYYDTKDAKLRNTHAWHKKAEEIKKESKYLCAVCFDKGIYNYQDLEVHHITKLREAPEKLLDNYNLVCLCRTCHKLADAGRIKKDYLLSLAEAREESTPLGCGGTENREK